MESAKEQDFSTDVSVGPEVQPTESSKETLIDLPRKSPANIHVDPSDNSVIRMELIDLDEIQSKVLVRTIKIEDFDALMATRS